DVVGKLLLRLVPLSVAVRLIHWPLCYGVRLRLVHQVSDPGSNWLDHYLRALALQEIKHVEVAIALGDLRPELTRDLYQRLYLGAINFERANLVNQVIDHIAQMHRVQHAETKVDGEFESRFARGCFDAVAVFKQQHAEAVKSSILQRKPILGFVHAEAAWSARSRGEE